MGIRIFAKKGLCLHFMAGMGELKVTGGSFESFLLWMSLILSGVYLLQQTSTYPNCKTEIPESFKSFERPILNQEE